MKPPIDLSPAHISGVIEMALSDHVSFADIEAEYGISDKSPHALFGSNAILGSKITRHCWLRYNQIDPSFRFILLSRIIGSNQMRRAVIGTLSMIA